MENYDIYENQSLYRTMNRFRAKRESRIALSVSAMLVFLGLSLGVVLYRICGDDISLDTTSIVSRYFGGMFNGADGFVAKVSIIFYAFLNEIIFPALVFVCGYTVFAPVLSAALCMWKATLCGFAICMLEFTSVNGIFVESLIYLVSQIAIISVSVSVAMRAFFFSDFFNSERVNLADVVKRAESRAYICDFIISAGVIFMTVAGTLILINFIR